MRDSSCQQFRQLSRRELLSIGSAGALGLGLPSLLQLRDATAASSSGSFGSAKSVIFLFLHGGHPQHETWDPKPGAPSEVRGEFGQIDTSISGYQISDVLPRCAALTDRILEGVECGALLVIDLAPGRLEAGLARDREELPDIRALIFGGVLE